MPFDELRRRALEALAARREAYHSAVATAVDEVRTLLEGQRAPTNGKGQRAAAELGAFAAGRIDTDRIASLFYDHEALDADAVSRIETALETLTGILDAGEDLHAVRVPAGGDLRETVRGALARAGRAFGAGRSVEAARSGGHAVEYTDGFSPERWNRAERTVSPPLVVDVDGADLRVGGLSDYLEGSQALVLLVRKPAALAALDGWDGPAVIAIVAEGAASFRYLPEEGGAGELVVESIPEERVKPIGTLTSARQEAELALLQLLRDAAAGQVVAAAATAEEAGDPADKLAAWLLRQADVPDPGEV